MCRAVATAGSVVESRELRIKEVDRVAFILTPSDDTLPVKGEGQAKKFAWRGEFFSASLDAQSGVAAKWRGSHLLNLAEGTSVKLSVIALDYDGTVARGDVLDPAVREAIAFARTHGIVVLLVTGRILDELRRVAGDLHFVDGVIAENGAVIHFPDSGRTSTLAPLV